MKVVIHFVAVVSLIGTIGANLVEYSEKALEDLTLTDKNADDMKAELINLDGKIEFKLSEDQEINAVYLEPALKRDPSASGLCGGNIGIKVIDTENVYCGIDIFGLEVDYFNEKQTLQLGVLFQHKPPSETAKPLILDIPIFVKPSKFAEGETIDKQNDFENWAKKNNVGIVYPLDSKNLSDILNKKNTTLTFKWLNDLLSFGISKGKIPVEFEGFPVPVDSFVTRPIVVSNDIVQNYTSLVETLQPVDNLYIDWD